MAKLYVHECDRCLKRIESKESEKPSAWVVAVIRKDEDELSGGESNIVNLLWCATCYYDIIKVLPQKRSQEF